jgi:hypothetical protein
MSIQLLSMRLKVKKKLQLNSGSFKPVENCFQNIPVSKGNSLLLYIMRTILVTGGAGYIGSHTLVELLQNTNFRVVSLDNFSQFP